MSDRGAGSARTAVRRRRAMLSALISLLVAIALSLGLSTSDATSSSTVQGPEQKLVPMAESGDEAGGSLSGFSVVMSGDGQTAVVGGPAYAGYSGAAWVWTRSGSGWTQQGPKLTAGEASGESCEEEADGLSGEEGPECGFGRALALSGDGNTLLIGAPRQEEQQGAAWIYTRTAGKWSRVAELTGAGETPKGRFGRAVALSADGTTALVSAPGDGAGRGRVWAFKYSGTGWSHQGEAFVGSGELGEGHFGSSLALSGDGTRALIGAPGDSAHLGAAWVFRRTGEAWSEEGSKLTGVGASTEAHFGGSVALSGDGSTALIGARHQSEDGGAAWVFTHTSSGWSQQGSPLKADEEAGEEFGYSVALSEDGSSALIGAPHDRSAHGSAWLFERSGASWSGMPVRFEGGSLETGKAWFGSSVSLSGDASSALVGAPSDHAKAGAAFIFGPSPSVSGISPTEGSTAGGTTVTISGANLGEASAVRFGEAQAASFKVESPSTISAVSPPGHGVVHITVQSPYGTSLSSSLDRFKYVAGTAGASASTSGSASGAASGTLGVLAFGPSSGGGCGVILLAKKLAVLRARAIVKLRAAGVGRCAGKLRLRVKLHGKGRKITLKTIGTAIFAVSPGRTMLVSIKLNAAGRSRLAAGHGHLNASLLLVKSSPAPLQARTASVRLARRKLLKIAMPKR
jgi:IPT/TIG domain/FG-GAP repeat